MCPPGLWHGGRVSAGYPALFSGHGQAGGGQVRGCAAPVPCVSYPLPLLSQPPARLVFCTPCHQRLTITKQKWEQTLLHSCRTLCLFRLLQTSPTAQKENVRLEIFDTLTGACVPIACFIAWPWSRAVLGYETALRSNLEECAPYGSAVLYLAKALAGLLVADAYNYWKHRLFHSRMLWPFHKVAGTPLAPGTPSTQS